MGDITDEVERAQWIETICNISGSGAKGDDELRKLHWTTRMMALCASSLGLLMFQRTSGPADDAARTMLMAQLHAASGAVASDVSPLRALGMAQLACVLASAQRGGVLGVFVAPEVVGALGNIMVDTHASKLEQTSSRYR